MARVPSLRPHGRRRRSVTPTAVRAARGSVAVMDRDTAALPPDVLGGCAGAGHPGPADPIERPEYVTDMPGRTASRRGLFGCPTRAFRRAASAAVALLYAAEVAKRARLTRKILPTDKTGPD